MNDNELRQAMSVLDAYQGQLEALSGQAQLLQMSFEESVRAKDTLEAIAKAKEGDEILIPIGAATFVPSVIPKNKKAVVGVGSRVSLEKDLDAAVEFMKNNISELSEALKKAESAIKEVDEAARKLSAAVQQEYQRRQQ